MDKLFTTYCKKSHIIYVLTFYIHKTQIIFKILQRIINHIGTHISHSRRTNNFQNIAKRMSFEFTFHTHETKIFLNYCKKLHII